MPAVSKEFSVDKQRTVVWDFFHSPDDLAQCVPGCESVEQVEEDVFDVQVSVDVAYTSLLFDTRIEITEKDRPASMSVEADAEPTGRMPGSAKANGGVVLAEGEENATEGMLTIEFSIRGRLGSLGESAFRHKCDEITETFIENVVAEIESARTAP